MVTTSRVWTAAELHDIPEDGCRYEALDGVLLVTPAPARAHSILTGRLVRWLVSYCETYGVGDVLTPGVVRWRSNELQPDIMVSPSEPRVARWEDTARPSLVVEIHSPSTQSRDRGIKRAAYMALGIAEYWQVSLDDRSVLVTHEGVGDVLVTSVLEWQPKPGIPPLRIDLHDLFR